jgi:phosphatidyl-myo-inositol dimannoside synthase
VKSLLLAPELFTGGGGIPRTLRLYLKALCELSQTGDRVGFVALNDAAVDSTELGRYSSNALSEWSVYNRSKVSFSRAAWAKGVRSDRIVCGHVAQLPLAWAVSLWRPHVRYFLVAHGIEVWRPFTFLERRALQAAHGVWCVSDYTRQQLIRHAPRAANRTAVLPNALDPGLEPPSLQPLPGGPPVILTVSRLSKTESYKGIAHLIAAMPAVIGQIPGARLHIVGRGDGLAALQRLVVELKLSEAVRFTGYRSDSELRDDFARCRLFALPSEKEGFGLVYLEAMANGRPCLGARSGAVPELITPETGVLVEFGDVPGIAAGIVNAVRREWRMEPLLERAEMFSYLRFKERLALLLSA